MQDLMTIKKASIWASKYIGKNVTTSNISYLIQYGRIPKIGDNGNIFVNRHDLEEYYNSHHETKEDRWEKQLGNDSFLDKWFLQVVRDEIDLKISKKGKNILQVENPKSNLYVKIDRSAGKIISHKKSEGHYNF